MDVRQLVSLAALAALTVVPSVTGAGPEAPASEPEIHPCSGTVDHACRHTHFNPPQTFECGTYIRLGPHHYPFSQSYGCWHGS